MPITRSGNVTQLTTVADNYYNTDEAQLELLANGNLAAVFRSRQCWAPGQNGTTNLRSVLLNQSGAAQSAVQLVASGDAVTYVSGATDVEPCRRRPLPGLGEWS